MRFQVQENQQFNFQNSEFTFEGAMVMLAVIVAHGLVVDKTLTPMPFHGLAKCI